MRICVAQTRPIQGDIPGNIENHKKLIDLAVAHGADTVIFPELSLTGYEPTLAKALAVNKDDNRFDDFQTIADSQQITIGVGVPTKSNGHTCISTIIFQPHQARQLYSKQYLHVDEEPFFIGGQSSPGLLGVKTNVALAICYELSVPAHAQQAFASGADIYVASVAKSADGVEQASKRLADIARTYAMTVLMSNCIGPSDDFMSAGKTAVWNDKGLLLEQLDDTQEGILIFDTDSQKVVRSKYEYRI